MGHKAMMLSDVCLSDVCCVHPVGGRRVRPAAWRVLADRARLGRPGSAGLAQGCRCALPLQTWARHIVAAARLQLVMYHIDPTEFTNASIAKLVHYLRIMLRLVCISSGK